MNKTYQKPEISVINIELQQMIAESPFTRNTQGELTGGKLMDEGASGAAMGRGDSDWDDED